MKTGSFDRYAPLKTALNGTGFKVESVEQQDKKTVITVSRRGPGAENPVFPVSGDMPQDRKTRE
jgi:hypothetical protein